MTDQDTADPSQVVIFFGDYQGKTIPEALATKDGKLRLSQMLEEEERHIDQINANPRLRAVADALHAVLDAKAEPGAFLFRCPWDAGILQKHVPHSDPREVGDHWEEGHCWNGPCPCVVLCSVANMGGLTNAQKHRFCIRCDKKLLPGEGRDIRTGFNATGDPFGPERVVSTCDKCNCRL